MTDELDALMVELSTAQTGARPALDKYREFREVFLGTEVGKRVLHDLLSWCHRYRSPLARNLETGDAHLYNTFVKLGEHNIGQKILTTIYVEPRVQPQKQRTKPEGD